jgi:hypothetical protein
MIKKRDGEVYTRDASAGRRKTAAKQKQCVEQFAFNGTNLIEKRITEVDVSIEMGKSFT